MVQRHERLRATDAWMDEFFPDHFNDEFQLQVMLARSPDCSGSTPTALCFIRAQTSNRWSVRRGCTVSCRGDARGSQGGCSGLRGIPRATNALSFSARIKDETRQIINALVCAIWSVKNCGFVDAQRLANSCREKRLSIFEGGGFLIGHHLHITEETRRETVPAKWREPCSLNQ